MKITTKEIESEKHFEPFELVIRVENEDELKGLWHRFNVIDGYMSRSNGYRYEVSVWRKISAPLWKSIDSKLQEFNINK